MFPKIQLSFCPYCPVHARSLCLISSKKLNFNNVRYFKINSTKDAGTKNGTENIKFLLTKASKYMREHIFPMLFPVFGANICNFEFICPDNFWREMCGEMANHDADSGCNKGQTEGYLYSS